MEEAIQFVANCKGWQSVKKLKITEETDAKTIMEFLASLNTGLDRKVEESLGKIVDLEEFLKQRRKQYFSLVKGKNLLFPQALPSIKELKKRFLLGIVTNSSRITANKSISPEFRKLFNAIITWSDVKKGKPDKEPVIKAMKALKVKPSECLFVGDSLDDAKASKAARVRFVGTTTGISSRKQLKKAGAWKIISNLSQIRRIIK